MGSGTKFPNPFKFKFFENQSSKNLLSGDNRLDLIFKKDGSYEAFFDMLLPSDRRLFICRTAFFVEKTCF